MAELASTLDADQEARLLQAESVVREFCRWHVAPLREVEGAVVAVVEHAQRIFLPTLRLVEVTALQVDGNPVDLAEVDWTRSGMVWRRSGWWSDGWARSRSERTRVTISYTHGHETVPSDVEAVVQAVATRAVANPGSLVRKQAGPFGDTYSQTGFNQSLPIALLDAERDILRAHRLVNIR